MIVGYEMRSTNNYARHTPWVVHYGEFQDWNAFESFKRREAGYRREVRNAKEMPETRNDD